MLWARSFSTILMSTSLVAKRGYSHSPATAAPIIVVFGRPGAGKTTVANEALQKFQSSTLRKQSNIQALGLDLDVCVPQWMRDNFAKGIYPTLDERNQFASEACDYVEKRLSEIEDPIALVSFSFVNTDLRENFRQRFPQTKWVLVDTTEDEAMIRIQQREGHFYKGAKDDLPNDTDEALEDSFKDMEQGDNSEWQFAPVDFEHTILNGANSIEDNCAILLNMVEHEVKQLV